MYQLKEESKEDFSKFKIQYYVERLSMTPKYIGDILRGYKCSEIVAKAFISICFNISLNEKQKINNLLEEHFNKLKD